MVLAFHSPLYQMGRAFGLYPLDFMREILSKKALLVFNQRGLHTIRIELFKGFYACLNSLVLLDLDLGFVSLLRVLEGFDQRFALSIHGREHM